MKPIHPQIIKIKMPKLLFETKLKESVLKCSAALFIKEVIAICLRLQINPNWLMAVMELETAGTFNPAITNKLGYTGLIQFGDEAAKDIGTTTKQLRSLNGLEQLHYVEKYLSRYKGKMKSLEDTYLAVFFPAAIGRPQGWVLQTSRLTPERIAKWNPLFDVNKDNTIQVWEIKQKLVQRIPNEYKWIA